MKRKGKIALTSTVTVAVIVFFFFAPVFFWGNLNIGPIGYNNYYPMYSLWPNSIFFVFCNENRMVVRSLHRQEPVVQHNLQRSFSLLGDEFLRAERLAEHSLEGRENYLNDPSLSVILELLPAF